MNIREVLRQTASSIAAHKLRSFLTMFGIIWGITSVILLVGLGKGFSRDQKERLKTIGVDLAIIWGGRTSEQAGGYAAGRVVRLSIRDAVLIKQEAYLIKTVSPELRRSVAEVSRYNAASRPVRGVWPDYQRFRSLKVQEGRLMTDDDENEGRRVVVLGVESRDQLFPGKAAIGETLMMNGSPYTVIGVLQKKKQNGSYGSGPDNTQLFVPYASMARDYPPAERPGIFKGWINNLVVEVGDPAHHEEALRQVYQILGREHHFDPRDKDALQIWDTLEGSQLVERIFDIMTIFFGAVALDDALARRHRRNEHHAGGGHRAHPRNWRPEIPWSDRSRHPQPVFRRVGGADDHQRRHRSRHRRGYLFSGRQCGIARYRAPSHHFSAGNYRVIIDAGTHHHRRRNVSSTARRRTQSDRMSAAGVVRQQERVELFSSIGFG